MTRRRVLALAGLGAASVGFAATAQPAPGPAHDSCATDLTDAEISLRASLEYTPVSKTDERCGGCAFFKGETPDASCGNCQIVSGPVSRAGYCSSWAAAPKT